MHWTQEVYDLRPTDYTTILLLLFIPVLANLILFLDCISVSVASKFYRILNFFVYKISCAKFGD